MGIRINQRTDYSTLFSGMQVNNQNASSFALSDYASIKNGSYFKLMKAYYSADSDKSSIKDKFTNAKGASVDSTAVNSSLQSSAKNLIAKAEDLLKGGKDSVFNKTEITTKDEFGNETKTQDYDKDKIFKAVSAFTDSYNSMLNAAKKSNNESVVKSASDMVMNSLRNENLLNKVGITIEDDNKLSINESKFKNADVATMKTLFQGAGSMAYSVESKASYMQMYAKEDAAKASGTYSKGGIYSPNLDTGSIYNGFM